MQIKTCAKCGQQHPLTHFTYLATLAQSKAWGRAGNVRMELESKNCRACRPKRKTVSRLTKKEIHNKVQAGDMNARMAKYLKQKQAQDERNKQAIASRKRWLKVWKAELKEALEPITKEITHARKVWLYAADKGYVDKADFYKEYTGMLKRAKEYAQYSHALHPRRPPSARWEDYIEPEVFARVRELWAQIPPIWRQAGRLPLLIKTRGQDVRNNQGESK